MAKDSRGPGFQDSSEMLKNYKETLHTRQLIARALRGRRVRARRHVRHESRKARRAAGGLSHFNSI